MSICRTPLRKHYRPNVQTFLMVGEQIRLQFPPKIVQSQQLDAAGDQAVNSRMLVRRQKMHGSRRCYGELAELSVDAGDKELRKQCWICRGEGVGGGG